MAQHSSRLQRLLTLLDTGSTQATRFAAARQIGEIAKSHPAELLSLLNKVSPYLRSRNWDSRVAAAQAIGAIAESVKHASLSEVFSLLEEEMATCGFSDHTKDIAAACSTIHPGTVAGLSFGSFDINKVLDFGSLLVASGGQEYDVAVDNSKTPAEKLARQKQNLRHRLGLDVCEQFMDVSDMIKDEDLLVQKTHVEANGLNHGYRGSSTGQSIQQFVSNMVPNFRPRKLSAREVNLLKRKARINAKDQPKDRNEDDEVEISSRYKPSTPKSEFPSPSVVTKGLLDVSADESSLELDNTGGWPFRHFVDQLVHDMFDPIWEVRHGAIMALREILTHQGASVGVYMPDLDSDMSWIPEVEIGSMKSEEIDLNESEPQSKRPKLEREPIQNSIKKELVDSEELLVSSSNCKIVSDINTEEAFNKEDKLISKADFLVDLPQSCKVLRIIKLARYSWIKNWEFLQDCALRFICVLALDRFGDYVSDQVVAPVRETCAQALGAILKYMRPLLVHETLQVLLQMQYRQEWEIRHGSLLGVKYLVAVRQDMLKDLLGYVLPACKIGLEDPDDDVRAVAADALIPATSALVSLKEEVLQPVVILLWDILLCLDDLNPSTSSVMNLLAELYSQSDLMLGFSASPEKKEFDLNEVSLVDENTEVMEHKDNPYLLSSLAPRLWPFMRHIITSVRHSAIRTLERLLDAGLRRGASDQTTSIWPCEILGDTLRIVFQNMLLETNDEILRCSERVWSLLLQCPEENLETSSKLYFTSWADLAATPTGAPLNHAKMYWPVALPLKSHFRAAAKMRASNYENENHGNPNFSSTRGSISGENESELQTQASPLRIIFGADNDKGVMSTRVATSTALGALAAQLPEESLLAVVDPLWKDVTSLSGVRRQVACLILIAWFKELKGKNPFQVKKLSTGILNSSRVWLLELLTCQDPSLPTKNSPFPYSELSRTYAKLRNEARKLFHLIESSPAFKDEVLPGPINFDTLGVEEAITFVSKLSLPGQHGNGNGLEDRHSDDLEQSKQRLLSTSCYLNCVQSNLHVSVSALIASAVVWMSELPAKLNPVILPLMASIKREQEEILQQKAAEALSELIFFCVGRKPSPNDKLVKNICNQTCMDFTETPQASIISSMEVIETQDLLNLGRTAVNRKSVKGHIPSAGEEKSKIEGFICRRGSELALKYLCTQFGPSLFDGLPKLWDCLSEFLKPVPDNSSSAEEKLTGAIDAFKGKDPQLLINNIQVVRSIAHLVHESLRPKLLTLLPTIILSLAHPHVAVRLAASRCITSMARTMPSSVMESVIVKVIPMLEDLSSICSRQGAGMLMSLLVQGMGVDLVAYAPLLIVPLLKCMSDSDQVVRSTVTHSFAALVPLLPLAKGLPLPSGLSEDLSRNAEDAKFLEQLLDNSQIDDYKLPVKLKFVLRRYQQEGINWLSFLRRFKLHGILCDDMGLGKTLQASAIVAADIVEGQVDDTRKEHRTLIICPSTLVGHWAYEIDTYVENDVFKSLQYVGSVQERMVLRDSFHLYNVIIASYDVVRKDIDFLEKLQWNYCILDEGHVIKNAKSKITNAVKRLKAENRLVLSGTPIQNNVLELWSLFDFLMPGFLGTERQFQASYGKPLAAARDPKCSPKDAEAGALAMEALHKQVMPFLLRRTKEEVLLDLPEKIIQDRYCDLSPVQLKLYEQFSGSDAKKEISTIVDSNDGSNIEETGSSKATSHIFQALQYLLKVCSHPLLVLGQKPPESLLRMLHETMPNSSDRMSSLHELEHSPKMIALKEILEECGIGQDGSGIEAGSTSAEHRVLIFAQHRSLLDIIEKDLFQAQMKNVTYLRLDGSVEPEKRFDIVKAFNSDPTIDVLLLTTHVGGLGLNLTSADTLVFMEHDWNPMRDHQAMDRAHRIGQRKVVNVHRLIMRGTIEEKVMSLQNFKVSVANAVINADNASLTTMNTDSLLDLFTPPAAISHKVEGGIQAGEEELDSRPGKKGLKAVLGGLGELWDQSQYDDFNLSLFLSKLNP